MPQPHAAALAAPGHPTGTPIPEDLAPTLTLLVKLGSIARHLQEATGPGGHHFDIDAATALLADPEISRWMTAADAHSLLPTTRR